MNGFLAATGEAWSSLPSTLRALAALLVGLLAASACKFLLSRLLAAVRFDRLSERTHFTEFLRKGGVDRSPSRLAGAIAYWIVVLAALYQAARLMDARIAESLADRAAELMPSLFAAAFVAILGSILVSFLANFTTTIARNAGIRSAGLVSRAIKLVGNLVVVTLALEQLGLGRTVLNTIFVLVFGALALGAAIAFGLGSVDLARDAVKRLVRSIREREREGRGGDLEG